jgi:tetratricopeptide (TPR) repeat protein
VALEPPRGAWTLHQWARAARDLGFLPDVAGAIGPAGFWSAPPARAYGAAGSLLGWLLARRGPGPVAALYRGGDFRAALGAPVEAVVAEWQAFLDGVAVPDGLAAAARARYLRPAVFAVPCAREVAALEELAWEEARAGQVAQACSDLRRVAEVTRRPGPLKQVGDLLSGRGDLEGAAEAYAAAARSTPAGEVAPTAQLASAQADLAWRRGDGEAALAGWRRALAAKPDRPEARLLLAKLTAAADPALATAACPLLLGTEPAAAALDRLARSDHPLAGYLWARQALARGEAAAALPRLERAAEGRLPGPIALEARFVLAEARCLGGEVSAGEAGLAALAAGAEAPVDRERAELGLRRCAFERRRAAPAAGAPPGR